MNIGRRGFMAGVLGFLAAGPRSIARMVAPPPTPAIVFDLAAASHHAATLGGDRILAVKNECVGQTFMIALGQDEVGFRRVRWFPGIAWQTPSVPALQQFPGNIDIFILHVLSPGKYVGFSTTSRVSRAIPAPFGGE